jgi:signal transduction histidine kinase
VSVLLFGALNVLVVGRIAYRALRAEQDRRIDFVVRLLAQRCERPLLVDDRLGLQKLIEESRSLDPELEYVGVRSPSGPWRALSATPAANAWLRSSGAPDGIYREAIEGILDGRFGTVRVGVLDASLRNRVSAVVVAVSAMVLVFLAAGLAGAAIVARGVTRPLERLVAFASNVRLEGPLPPLPTGSGDEIEELGTHLENQALRLQALHAEARDRDRQLARVEHLATVGRLAAGLAHEVCNPLAGIRSGLERVLRLSRDEKEAQRYGGVLRDAVARIERTVKGTLDFARAAEVMIKPTSLAECVERAFELGAPQLEKARVGLVQSLPPELPLLAADPQRLVQVVLNLLLNACDAMPAGGQLSVSAQVADGFVVAEFSDTGTGIPDEIAASVFDPFFTTKPPGEGTGLGLAVSRTAVREMGGELELVDHPGRGAAFRLRLPLQGGQRP